MEHITDSPYMMAEWTSYIGRQACDGQGLSRGECPRVACLVAIQSAVFSELSLLRIGTVYPSESTLSATSLHGPSGEPWLESLGCHVKSQAGVWESNLG
jgi:hypothetical protein